LPEVPGRDRGTNVSQQVGRVDTLFCHELDGDIQLVA
jgi:hypothetical protein